MTRITLTVNGKPVEADVEPRQHLADFLRDQLHLTGTHIGCEHGICGACTVEIDGEISRSCITYAVACDGARINTLEGFGDDKLMGRLRTAFAKHHALQCGYCTPGMLIAARDLIRRKGDLSEHDIRVEMSGNLCRCTGYLGIVNAVSEVMAERGVLVQASANAPATALGPAPGPGRGSATPARQAAASQRSSQLAPFPRDDRAAPAAGTRAAPASAGPDTGMTRLAQSFTIAAPRAEVWKLMADTERVAQCMPGVKLDTPVNDAHISGSMQIKLGPIAASFAGDGSATRVPEEYRGLISGRGRDTRSASQAQARVEYTLTDAAADKTRVDVAIAYALTGPLAQFSRGSIVRDLVDRLAETFARNLEARLKNPDAAVETARLNAGSLVLSVLWSRIKVLLGLK